jgi:hypothetical protein
MICRLCRKPKTLCNSHIIPEFLYQSLYESNEKHHFIQVSGSQKVRKWQKGFKEKLLCRECEDMLCKWESYAAKVIYGGIDIEPESLKDAIILHHVDYPIFKLFELSLIWRAGICSLPQFAKVALGPHEEIIRLMILNNNPGSFTEYGCFLVLTPSYFDFVSKMMMLSQPSRFANHRCYIFLISGLTWVFFVSSHTETLPYRNRLFLSQDGTLPILIENVVSKKFFEQTFAELKRSGSIDKAVARILHQD